MQRYARDIRISLERMNFSPVNKSMVHPQMQIPVNISSTVDQGHQESFSI